MANYIRHVSSLISPKCLSPLVSPRSAGISRSERNNYTKARIRDVTKKLDFSPGSQNVTALPKEYSNHQIKIPNILIDGDFLNLHDPISHSCGTNSNKDTRVLEIDSPVKLELLRNGLTKLKNCTSVLGKGSFGIVFKAKYKENMTAVKLISSQNATRERNALGLAHINIVSTLEIIHHTQYQSYNLVIMDYLPNSKSLQEILDNPDKNNSSEQLKSYARGVTCGLQYLHGEKIIHLDLKPKNIIVDMNNICKICDFGNSAKIGEHFQNIMFNGTITYTAPEIFMGAQPTIKSDIYSLGMIFWQMKYRRNPFHEFEDVESIVYNIVKHNVRPYYEKGSSDKLVEIFTSCWDPNPDQRPFTSDILVKLAFVEF